MQISSRGIDKGGLTMEFNEIRAWQKPVSDLDLAVENLVKRELNDVEGTTMALLNGLMNDRKNEEVPPVSR